VRQTHFDQLLARLEFWLELIDLERDGAMQDRPLYAPRAWRRWVDRLEHERAEVVSLLGELRPLRHRWPLLLEVRPAMMLKASPASSRRRRRAAV
jgi:hypothetical protein